MTLREELEAAYDRLSKARNEGLPPWRRGSDGPQTILFRTIDAQLAILQYSFVFAEWHERDQPDGGGAMRTELHHALELARAINRTG